MGKTTHLTKDKTKTRRPHMKRKAIKSLTASILSVIMMLSGILTIHILEPEQLSAQVFEYGMGDVAVSSIAHISDELILGQGNESILEYSDSVFELHNSLLEPITIEATIEAGFDFDTSGGLIPAFDSAFGADSFIADDPTSVVILNPLLDQDVENASVMIFNPLLDEDMEPFVLFESPYTTPRSFGLLSEVIEIVPAPADIVFTEGVEPLVSTEYQIQSYIEQGLFEIGIVPAMNNTTLTILYRGNGHTSGTVPHTHSVPLHNLITLSGPGTLARTGHVFAGWRNSAGQVFPVGYTWRPTTGGILVLDAVWLPPSSNNTVTVTYNGNGNTGGTPPTGHMFTAPGSFTVMQPSSAMVRAGYRFTGWRVSHTGQVFVPPHVVSVNSGGTIRLDAVWERDGSSNNTVTIVFRSSGHTTGSPPANITVSVPGGSPPLPHPNMTKTGHMFVGWRTQFGDGLHAGYGVWFNAGQSGTFTLDAIWHPIHNNNIVTVQFRSSGHTTGSPPASFNVTTPGTWGVPGQTMTRVNHGFGGWRAPDGEIFFPATNVHWNSVRTGTLTLDAIWISLNTLTVMFVSDGHTTGSPPSSRDVTTPGSLVMPEPGMTRTGHTFGGWRNPFTGQVVQPGASMRWDLVTQGVTLLHAVWIPSNTVTIQFTSTGHTTGSPPPNRVVNTPYTLILPQPGMTRTGHSFGGWRLTHAAPGLHVGQTFLVGQPITVTQTGTIRFEAVWNPNTVTVHWNTHGGNTIPPWTNMVPNTRLDTRGELPRPTRNDGLEFAGWFRTVPTPFSIIYGQEDNHALYHYDDGFTFTNRFDHLDNEFNYLDTAHFETHTPLQGIFLMIDCEYGGEHSIEPFALPPDQIFGSTLVPNNGMTANAAYRMPAPVITSPAANQQVAPGNLQISWQPIQGSATTIITYDVTVRVIIGNTSTIIAQRTGLSQANTSVNISNQYVGHAISITLAARSSTGHMASIVRSHTVRAGNVTITLNANGGQFNGGVNTTTITREPNSFFGTLAPPTRSGGHNFVGWFDTPNPTGGRRIVPNTIITSSNTFYARWTDPNRHMPYWWPAAPEGVTVISMRILPSIQGGAWVNAVNSGMSNWNNLYDSTRVRFTNSSFSANTVGMGNLDGGLLGLLTPQTSNTSILSFHIDLRSSAFQDPAIQSILLDFPELFTAVMAHELGHAIGLEDNAVLDSLMNATSVIDNQITAPTDFDIESVNMLYN